MDAELVDGRILIKNRQSDRLSQRGFGIKQEDGLELSVIEALFLIERGTLKVLESGKTVPSERLMELTKNDQDFFRRYSVYKSLRGKGYVVRTGFKYGAHFRVYERGEYSNEGHSSLLVHVVTEEDSISFPEISRAVRLSQSVKKSMVFAVVDSEGDIIYYEVDRVAL